MSVIVTEQQTRVTVREDRTGVTATSARTIAATVVEQGVTLVERGPDTEVVTVGVPGPQGPPGPTGGSGDVLSREAAEPINAGRAVYADAGGLRVWTPAAALAGRIVGIARTSATTGQDVEVVASGACVIAGEGYVAGARYFVGLDGALTTAAPGSAEVLQRVGVGLDANTLIVDLYPPIVQA